MSADTRTRGESEAAGGASQLPWSGPGVGEQAGESHRDGNAASATDLFKAACDSHSLSRTSFSGPSRTKGQQGGSQAGCPGVPGLSAPAGWPRALG